MFSSMTHAMAKCQVPNGTQTYWDKTNQEIKKITLEASLKPVKMGTQTSFQTQDGIDLK